jgi:hypothetical protein
VHKGVQVQASLTALGHEVFAPAGAPALMQLIHERFTNEPNATSVATRAPEALAELHGVCQDFAHVMIGACRSLGLAARYVSGYLLTKPHRPTPTRWRGRLTRLGSRSGAQPKAGWRSTPPTPCPPAPTTSRGHGEGTMRMWRR